MEKYFIYFSETALHKPLVMQRTQNTIAVCDARTGAIYRATGLYLEPDACMLLDKKLLAAIDTNQIIHFETYKGPVSSWNLAMQMNALMPDDFDRVVEAKARFERDKGWATLGPALEALEIS
jgi:hypothetical protein